MSVSEKMMGNDNAEKWSFEKAEAFCEKVLYILSSQTNIRTLGGACIEAGGYEELICYFEKKFKTVFQPIKKAKEIVKSRLVEQGLDGEVNPTMAIFILKNNHNMKDRTDVTTNDKDIESTPIFGNNPLDSE